MGTVSKSVTSGNKMYVFLPSSTTWRGIARRVWFPPAHSRHGSASAGSDQGAGLALWHRLDRRRVHRIAPAHRANGALADALTRQVVGASRGGDNEPRGQTRRGRGEKDVLAERLPLAIGALFDLPPGRLIGLDGARSPPMMLRTCSPRCSTMSRGAPTGTVRGNVVPGGQVQDLLGWRPFSPAVRTQVAPRVEAAAPAQGPTRSRGLRGAGAPGEAAPLCCAQPTRTGQHAGCVFLRSTGVCTRLRVGVPVSCMFAAWPGAAGCSRRARAPGIMGRIGCLDLTPAPRQKTASAAAPGSPRTYRPSGSVAAPLQAVATQGLHDERDARQIDLDDPLQDRDLASPPALVIGLRQRAETGGTHRRGQCSLSHASERRT